VEECLHHPPDDLHQEILDSISDPLYAVDADWRITYVNDKLEEVWQRRRDELLGAVLWDVFPDYQQSSGAQSIQRAMRERVSVHFEVFSPYLSTWIEVSAHPLASGGLTVYFLDITARKQAEEALRQAQAELERRVEERTAELQQRNRDLDDFAYAASHDLRAPLRGIRNLAEWIEQDAGDVLPPASAVHLAKLQGRIQRLDQLLTALLAYSRAGRQRHEPETIDVAALTRSAFDLLAPPPGFALILQEPLPVFRGERAPLEAVLRNLLGNAIKHHHQTQCGSVSVAAVEENEWIEFTVSDDGPGIEPQYQERIFQIFQTLAARDQVEGSGVGLSLVKKLVESRGGLISVQSAPGQGATFRFTWPAIRETADQS
jgi:PAS domain S-box-containing protein